MAKHRYNLIRFDTATAGTSYKLFVRGLYDYVIVKEITTSDVTERSYFVAAKDLETSWTNRASLTYSIDIRGRKLVNEGQNWLAAAGRTFTGLLDTYGGAAAAYSLQLLSTDYSGNCVTVRRASDNATLDIGFSNNELDTASLESFCSGVDGYVTAWYDQSGNAFNVVQTTASAQPKIVSSGSVILQSGKPSIEFDGVDDYLENATSQNESIMSLFNVFYNNESADGRLGSIRYPATTLRTFAQQMDNTLRYDGAFTAGTLTHSIGYKLRFSRRSTTNVLDYINSVENINTAITLPNIEGYINIGNAISSLSSQYFFDGKVQAAIIYNSDQSSNRIGIETALNDYYSIY